MLEEILNNLNTSLNSSDQNVRMSAVGLLANCMWSSDPKEKAEAICIMFAILKHPDLAVVQKASTALSEIGPIGWRYMEMATMDPQINAAAKAVISVKQKASEMEHLDKNVYSQEEFKDIATTFLNHAGEDVKYQLSIRGE